MDIEEIKRGLSPKLNEVALAHEIDYVNIFSDPLLFILNYSPHNSSPLASFAFSLESYGNNGFPRKCWMTRKNIVPINEIAPNSHPDYKQFSFGGHTFYPYSVDLSKYNPQDVNSIRCLVNELYAHINFNAP